MAKKKGKKGGKAKVEKTMTWNEALLAYKLLDNLVVNELKFNKNNIIYLKF